MTNLSQYDARDVQITVDYENGETAQQIAERHGLTRERVCQILRRSNAIELRAERRRLIKGTFEREAADLEAEALADFEEKLGRAIELVRGGKSLAAAGREVGLTRNKINYLGIACKKAGVATVHGRWRDNGPKQVRVRELRATNLVWSEISRICEVEGLGKVTASWVADNCPELVRHRSGITPAQPKEPKPVRVKKVAPPPVDPDEGWTAERTAILIRLWLAGTTSQQCADILGTTRNAIIGKVNRVRVAGELKNPSR